MVTKFSDAAPSQFLFDFIVFVFLSSDMLRFDSLNADAIYVRGLCLYYQDSIDKAFQHFQHVLRLAPDHDKAKDTYKVHT